MHDPPSLSQLVDEISQILKQACQKDVIASDRPLVGELGFDSLDMIEAAFSMEDRFGFQFAEKHPLDVLNEIVGADIIVKEGLLTPLGREMAIKRMPELGAFQIEEGVSTDALQAYYTVETYARMLREFYLALPEVDPETQELIVLDGLRPVTQTSGKIVNPPAGDELVKNWALKVAAEIK